MDDNSDNWADDLANWLPIDSAPKDGRNVVIGWIANGRLEHSQVAHWNKNRWQGGHMPTHWFSPPAGDDNG